MNWLFVIELQATALFHLLWEASFTWNKDDSCEIVAIEVVNRSHGIDIEIRVKAYENRIRTIERDLKLAEFKVECSKH